MKEDLSVAMKKLEAATKLANDIASAVESATGQTEDAIEAFQATCTRIDQTKRT